MLQRMLISVIFFYSRGRFGIVSKVKERATGKFYAAKYIKVRAATRCIVRQEIDLLCAVRHKRIVKLYDVFEESRRFILVLEWYVYVNMSTFSG